MTKIGIDIGKTRSDVCVMETRGEVSVRFRCPTTRSALRRHFANYPKAEIALESCREARWIGSTLKELGHIVFVVDTSRAREIGIGRGGRKTDQRDAEALARVLWTGVIPEAHVMSERAARLRDVLLSRKQLVGQRSALVTMLRGQWQAHGLQAPKCTAANFEKRLREMQQDLVHAPYVQAVLEVLRVLNEQIEAITSQLESLAQAEESYERLCSVPGVKLMISMAFVAAIDNPYRFKNAHQVQAFLGLVPREASTGGRRRLGSITKVGNAMARVSLIQAAHILFRVKGGENDPLIIWAKQIAERRGKRVAAVALARRLVGILWAMWVDGTFYEAKSVGRASAKGLARRARRAQSEAAEMKRALFAA